MTRREVRTIAGLLKSFTIVSFPKEIRWNLMQDYIALGKVDKETEQTLDDMKKNTVSGKESRLVEYFALVQKYNDTKDAETLSTLRNEYSDMTELDSKLAVMIDEYLNEEVKVDIIPIDSCLLVEGINDVPITVDDLQKLCIALS